MPWACSSPEVPWWWQAPTHQSLGCHIALKTSFSCIFLPWHWGAGVLQWQDHHIFNCPGGHQPHFLPLSWSRYWIRVTPDVREGKDVTLEPLFHPPAPYAPASVIPTSSPFPLVVQLSLCRILRWHPSPSSCHRVSGCTSLSSELESFPFQCFL